MTKILIIEDHADTRDLIQIMLEAEGYEVAQAETGEEGIKTAREFQPALILLDISLAGKTDGLEVARYLRADSFFDQTIVVALTAHAMRDDAERVVNAGCDLYWTKPVVDFEQFSRDLRKAIQNGRKVPAARPKEVY